MPRLLPTPATLLAAAAVALAGCGGGEEGGAPVSGTGASGARTPAADLRAQLAAALTERAYLDGLALAEGVGVRPAVPPLRTGITPLLPNGITRSGPPATGTVPAAPADLPRGPASLALRLNGAQLGRVLTRSSGDAEAGDAFEAGWAREAEALEDYARGKVAGDEKLTGRAVDELDAVRAALGGLVAGAGKGLAAPRLAEDLAPAISGLASATDALVQRAPVVPDRLRLAAAATGPFSAASARALAAASPGRITGAATRGAPEFRAGLTRLFVSHAALTAIAASQSKRAGFTSQSAKAASRALDANGVQLSELMASVYGEKAARNVLVDWRERLGAERDYARALGARDRDAVAKTRIDIADANRELASTLSILDPDGSEPRLLASLERTTDATAGSVRAFVTGSPKAYGRLREATASATTLAAGVADRIARQFPRRFPST